MSFTYGTQVFAEGSVLSGSGYLSRKHLKRAIKYGSRYAAGPLLLAPSEHSLIYQPSHPAEHAPLFSSKGGYYSSRSFSHYAGSHDAMRYGSMAPRAAPMTFYSNPICPFAHRVWLSLLETRTPHEFKHVPLDESGAGREWCVAPFPLCIFCNTSAGTLQSTVRLSAPTLTRTALALCPSSATVTC